MICLVCAFLWRIGGAGWKPFGKNWRRIGVPLVVLASLLFSGAGALKSILSAVLILAALRLPLTFFGNSLNLSDPDEINKPFFFYDLVFFTWELPRKKAIAWNWTWLWIAGYLLGLVSVVTHGWSGLIYSCIPAIAQGVSVSLSNIPGTAKDWPHELCEVITAVSVVLAILG